jgi:hypothetical protein
MGTQRQWEVKGRSDYAGALFLAVAADAIDLKVMPGGREVVLATDFALEALDLGGEKFDGAAAIGADHMVMAATIELGLVAGDTVLEGDGAGEAALGEKLERAIDGGEADTRVFFAYEAVELVGGEVVGDLEEGAQDGVALFRVFQSDTLEVLVEDLFGFPQHLGRNGTVVDAFLQHEVKAVRNSAHCDWSRRIRACLPVKTG